MERERAARSRTVVVLVSIAILGAVWLFFVSSSEPAATSSPRVYQPPKPKRAERNGLHACTLMSSPSGAAVYGDTSAYIINNRDTDVNPLGPDRHFLGTTPIPLAQVGGYQVEVELEGYRTKTVNVPATNVEDLDAPCNLSVTLERSPAPSASPR
jgi:hypothetical protein